MMIIFLAFFLFLGGFIYGIFLLQFGLSSFSTELLRKRQNIKFIDSPWKYMLLGGMISIISQNYFAVIIMTGRLVAARILTFEQSIGIILGAYIGKTLMIEIITIDLHVVIIPMVLIGAILCLIKMRNFKNIGYGLIGLSLVFGAMRGLKIVAPLLANNNVLLDWFITLDQSHLYAVLTGLVVTLIIQSSPVTAGLTMSFLLADTMHLSTGIAIIFGANIGSSILMLLTTGSEKKAKVITYTYTSLTIFSVALIYPFLDVITRLGKNLSSAPDLQLAHLTVILHIIISLVGFVFINLFKSLLTVYHNKK